MTAPHEQAGPEAETDTGTADGTAAADLPQPNVATALVPVVATVAIFVGGIGIMEYPAELMLIFAGVVFALFAVWHGRSMGQIVTGMGEKIKRALPAILILLSIGMLIGTWMISGTIPLMVHYGLELIDPAYLYVLAFIVTAIVATFTGTSWGAGGTIGVALIGVAETMDVSLAITAGAVVSGAYFGDKLSPLSDTTNMSALAAGANLYEHIRHMLYTAVPSSLLAITVFLIAGSSIGASSVDLNVLDQTSAELNRLFTLNPLLLLPPAVVLIGSIMKKPPLVVLFVSSISALLLGVLVQGFSLGNLFAAATSGFTTDMLPGGDVSETLTSLLERGGLYSMYSSAFFVFCAFFFASALENSNVLRILLGRLIRKLRSTGGLVATTLLSGFAIINGTSNALVTFFLVNDLYREPYRRQRLHPVNLSRSMEDSVTITEVLMPWTVSGVFFATTLGVGNFDFLPWAVFNWSGFLFSALLAFLAPLTRDFGIRRIEREPKGDAADAADDGRAAADDAGEASTAR
ncbi:Na+/H+ antiporter NhaC [Streptomonospora litoralis]|uniref:Malate-2H(+)/Na(+)-lactate antiporter n=1 Tax=Streptomonospora litoralis TaxID=2498135 RepID=A0A4P6Q730_9ACTN|nr:Na+/H+ antiporter NhaC [Streptomonospora litoralis]QBI56503.1 Malate-2H(+)/Na(+)-lactate antiporter [Streptomonospora litoralis]